MNHQALDANHQEEVTHLFTSVFADSEGEQEGKLIGNLAKELTTHIDNINIFCFAARSQHSLIGVIFFTRLKFTTTDDAFMLAPVAISTQHQGKRIGQALIQFGLDEMRNRSIDVIITYGDPAYYSKVGFRPLSQEIIKAPLQLSQPEGWQGLSLIKNQISSSDERPICVSAFNNPTYW